MAVGGKRSSAGERVLEGRHVIGLFFLMLLFSGVFFTLGYVMGRNQFEGQVRAETNARTADVVIPAKHDSLFSKKSEPVDDRGIPTSEAPASATPEWEFYKPESKKNSTETLKPSSKNEMAETKPAPVAKNTSAPSKGSLNAPLVPRGSFSLQVAALTKQSDALALASSLQKRKFTAYVIPPQGDKYYRVQVGPFATQKAADAARKNLEGAGFKAIVKH